MPSSVCDHRLDVSRSSVVVTSSFMLLLSRSLLLFHYAGNLTQQGLQTALNNLKRSEGLFQFLYERMSEQIRA